MLKLIPFSIQNVAVDYINLIDPSNIRSQIF